MHLIRIIRETGGVVYRQPNAAVALDNDDIIYWCCIRSIGITIGFYNLLVESTY